MNRSTNWHRWASPLAYLLASLAGWYLLRYAGIPFLQSLLKEALIP